MVVFFLWVWISLVLGGAVGVTWCAVEDRARFARYTHAVRAILGCRLPIPCPVRLHRHGSVDFLPVHPVGARGPKVLWLDACNPWPGLNGPG